VLSSAITVAQDDIKGFSKAIVSLLDDDELAGKMAKENKQEISGISWEKAAKKILDVFESVI
jgi:glycosyltransferase involved in cell wall biosynthesis